MFNGVQHVLIPLTSSELELTDGEKNIIDEVLKHFKNFNAREISDYSHKEPGWRTAEDYGTISYETAHWPGFLSDIQYEVLAELAEASKSEG